MGVRHPELVLAGAAVVSLPMVPGILSGSIGASTAALRFLIALVACWVLGAVLSWVVSTYSAQARRAEIMRLIQEPKRAAPREAGDEPGRAGQ